MRAEVAGLRDRDEFRVRDFVRHTLRLVVEVLVPGLHEDEAGNPPRAEIFGDRSLGQSCIPGGLDRGGIVLETPRPTERHADRYRPARPSASRISLSLARSAR